MKNWLCIFSLSLAVCGCEPLTDAELFNSVNGNFNGTWRASGVIDLMGSSVRDCDDADLIIEQTLTTLTIKERNFSCNNYPLRWDTQFLTVNDGKLFSAGFPAGRISSDSLDVEVALGNSKTWRLTIKQVSGKTRYSESITNESTTTASLTRLY